MLRQEEKKNRIKYSMKIPKDKEYIQKTETKKRAAYRIQ